jgi:hypothetical protein
VKGQTDLLVPKPDAGSPEPEARPEARRVITNASQTRYIPRVRELLRKHRRFFLWTALAGLALRLLFVFAAPQVTDDSRIYADIAKNWLAHGMYGITDSGQIVPTYIRLPGYPAFLAIVFAVFGRDNFRAVLLIQVLVDLGTCFLIADLARRLFTTELAFDRAQPGFQHGEQQRTYERAAHAAFLLAAVCPFLANYTAAALTETLEVFFTVVAFDLAVVGLDRVSSPGEAYFERGSPTAAKAASKSTPDAALKRCSTRAGSRAWSLGNRWLAWAACGLAIGAAILLRPDGGLMLVSVGVYLAVRLANIFVRPNRHSGREIHHPDARRPMPAATDLIWAGSLVAIFALAPLVPWTLRNLRTMHAFQPLAPRYATNPGDYVPMGFNRWVKTWMADYVSVQEIYWQEPGVEIDIGKLPSRAFDSAEQKQRTADALNWYNQVKDIDPELDAQFADLANERIHAAPLRYYLWLPLVRIADMWLRPRTELLPVDPRWWEFNDDMKWMVTAVGFGVINLIYVGLAVVGVFRGGLIRWLALLVFFVALRSVFLGTLENPETRYTLECYPVVIAMAGGIFAAIRRKPRSSTYGNR